MQKVHFQDLGLIDYKEAWDYQEELFKANVDAKIENRRADKTVTPTKSHLLFCEHPHVYTLGKSGDESHLLLSESLLKQKGATYYKINRGGDITYHGPGQIVGYPILDLDNFSLGLKDYIYKLEDVIIKTLEEFGISSSRLDGATGVWLDVDTESSARKICAIGVRTSRFVSMHGFAFNVNTDLDYFGYINPCGFTNKGVTSLEKELGKKQDITFVKEIVKTKFVEVFGMEIL